MASLFDLKRVSANRRRAQAIALGSFLRPKLVESAIERLSWIRRPFSLSLEVGSDDDQLASHLEQSGYKKPLTQSDLIPPSGSSFQALFAIQGLEIIDDLPGLLRHFYRALEADGLLLLALLGGDTLTEVRQAFLHVDTAFDEAARLRVHPSVSWQDMGKLLQQTGFSLPVVDRETYQVAYPSLVDLARDLRAMGLGTALHERNRFPLTKARLYAVDSWLKMHSPAANDRFLVTFDCLWAMGWTPHPNQPEAKRPGSATIGMAEALAQLSKDGESRQDKVIEGNKPTEDNRKSRHHE